MCSLADNAVTAADSEWLLQQLYETLDREKLAAIDAVNVAVSNYREQHASIVEVPIALENNGNISHSWFFRPL